jgi:membrane protease YdiL (CAAX protease family)
LSTAPVAAPQRPDLPAPLWHTGLILLYVLVPRSWWPGWSKLIRALPYNTGAVDILGMVMYAAAVALVCFGLSLHQNPLEDLLGKLWSRWQDALRDLAIAAVFWMLVRYADRLIYYLADAHPTPRRLVPHTVRDLVISVLLAIAAGVAEEIIFRGYLQKQFAALFANSGAAILIQAGLFACYHGYHQTLPVFGQHFLFALLAGSLAQWRESLLPGMIGHAWLDAYWDLLKLAKLA